MMLAALFGFVGVVCVCCVFFLGFWGFFGCFGITILENGSYAVGVDEEKGPRNGMKVEANGGACK